MVQLMMMMWLASSVILTGVAYAGGCSTTACFFLIALTLLFGGLFTVLFSCYYYYSTRVQCMNVTRTRGEMVSVILSIVYGSQLNSPARMCHLRLVPGAWSTTTEDGDKR